MKKIGLFLSILSIQTHLTKAKVTEVTEPIETRIDILKQELIKEIEEEQNKPVIERNDDDDVYEYVDLSNQPITPINTFDKRKLKDRFKLPELKSTTTEKFVASESEMEEEIPKSKLKHLRVHGKRERGHRDIQRPLDIFYRKMTFDKDEQSSGKFYK